jgi:putative transposase
MGSVADRYAYAMCESFFATLECVLLDQNPLHTQAEPRMTVFDFIEGWYSPRRRHSALDCMSPNEYEKGTVERSTVSQRLNCPNGEGDTDHESL